VLSRLKAGAFESLRRADYLHGTFEFAKLLAAASRRYVMEVGFPGGMPPPY